LPEDVDINWPLSAIFVTNDRFRRNPAVGRRVCEGPYFALFQPLPCAPL